MPFHQMLASRSGLPLAAFLATCFLTGCPQAPRETSRSEDEPEHHRQSHRHHPEGIPPQDHHPRESGTGSERSGETPEEVAEKAKAVLRHIDEHNEAPRGYEGGRVFHNSGSSGEQVLPKHDDRGRAIAYREWDVNPKLEGVNRGTERLITGSDGSAYVTADHYKTFKKIR